MWMQRSPTQPLPKSRQWRQSFGWYPAANGRIAAGPIHVSQSRYEGTGSAGRNARAPRDPPVRVEYMHTRLIGPMMPERTISIACRSETPDAYWVPSCVTRPVSAASLRRSRASSRYLHIGFWQ